MEGLVLRCACIGALVSLCFATGLAMGVKHTDDSLRAALEQAGNKAHQTIGRSLQASTGKLGKQKATTPANAPSPFFAIPVGGGQGATPPSATSGSLGAPPQATPRGSGTNSTPASTGTLTPTGPPTNVGGSKTPGTPPSTGGSPPPSLVGSPPTTPATTTPTTPTNGKKAGPLADYSSSTDNGAIGSVSYCEVYGSKADIQCSGDYEIPACCDGSYCYTFADGSGVSCSNTIPDAACCPAMSRDPSYCDYVPSSGYCDYSNYPIPACCDSSVCAVWADGSSVECTGSGEVAGCCPA